MLKVQMAVPFGVTRSSGSRVRLPMSMTLLRLAMGNGAKRSPLGGLDEGAVDAVVEAQALVELGRCFGRGREVDLDVDAARELVVGLAGEFAAAEVLDGGDVALHGDDFFLHAIDDLVDGVFLAPVIENEGGFVVTLVLAHGYRGG